MVNGITQKGTAIETVVSGIRSKKGETDKLAEKKANCERRGGRWDEATQTCILPTEETTQVTPDVSIKTTKTTREAGIIEAPQGLGKQGIVLPDGRTFFGLNKQDIENLKRKEGLTDEDLKVIGTEGRVRQSQKERILSLAQDLGLEPEQVEQKIASGELPAQQLPAQISPVVEDVEVGKFDTRGFFTGKTAGGRTTVGGIVMPEDTEILEGTAPISPVGGFGGWKIGEKIIFEGKKAVQLGTTIKNSALVVNGIKLLKSAFFFVVGAKLLDIDVLGSVGFLNKVDEQQQALNTLGQITSTIVGDSTSGAGDYKQGLQELRHIKQSILELERDIRQGTIKSITLETSGKIIDINADVFDQLATLDEGIRDIQTFALQGSFPELSEYELQSLLRELEEEGFIEPVDLTKVRRETSPEK